ncbi:unnamed protein product [Orchesella dallaii]|uniref:Uncharacterized protein n=1 Tax=Orchesella dallaii TaxID=48710 RepID=A0ABP1PU07_9HEXA
MSFYHYVSSNDCLKYFPKNTAANFKIKTPFKLNGADYNVAVMQVYFKDTRPLFLNPDDYSFKLTYDGRSEFANIPIRKYFSINDLVVCMNEQLREYTEKISLQFDNLENRVCIRTLSSSLILSAVLSTVLGMRTCVFEDTVAYSSFPASLDNIDNDILITTDFSKPQSIGSNQVPFIDIKSPSDEIFTKGQQKCDCLQNILENVTVQNLEDLDCPPIVYHKEGLLRVYVSYVFTNTV